MSSWKTVRREMREVAWLASIIGALSVLTVGLAWAAVLVV